MLIKDKCPAPIHQLETSYYISPWSEKDWRHQNPIGEADHSFQEEQSYIGDTPSSFILLLQNRWKIKIFILKGGGLVPPCYLGSFANAQP